MTEAKRWAQKRNFAKFRLKGMREALRSLQDKNFVLSAERSEMKQCIMTLNEILSCWKKRNGLSKKQYLGR